MLIRNKCFAAFSFVTLFACTFSVQAITEYPRWYNPDPDATSVLLDDLEWLRWDETLNMSINDALSAYSGDGWRLATSSEMSSLFNDYFLGEDELFYSSYDSTTGLSDNSPQPFDNNENTRQSTWDPATHTSYSYFSDSFGLTDYYCDPDEFYGCQAHTAALFGDDLDGDGLYNLADLSYESWPDDSSSLALIDLDRYSADHTSASLEQSGFRSFSTGIALVRSADYGQPVSAPEIDAKEAAVAIALLLGLVLVGRERFQITQRRGIVLNS